MGIRERITQLREQRASAFERMKEINDAAVDEERNLSSEEDQEWRKANDDVTGHAKEIERLERQLTLEDESRASNGNEPGREDVRPGEQDGDGERSDRGRRSEPLSYPEYVASLRGAPAHATPEYRRAWLAFVRSAGEEARMPQDEYRALATSPGPEGGYLVPTTTFATIITKLVQFSAIRELARIITTDSGEPIKVPVEADFGATGWTAQNTPFSESDPVLGQAELNAFKLTRLCKVPEELFQDAIIDLEAYLTDAFARSAGIGLSAGYLTGTGAGQPTGIIPQLTSGVEAPVPVGAAPLFDGDNIIDTFYSVRAPYRKNASWIANDLSLAIARKLKDTVGQYLWQAGLQQGQPDLLHGKPVYSDPFMPEPVTPAHGDDPLPVIAFGDWSYCMIRDVNGIGMQRLVERYADEGQVGFRMWLRSDIAITQLEAIKTLTLTPAA